MTLGLLIGIGSGAASALLFYSAARGTPLFGMALIVLTPLPSLIAAFGWGTLTAAAGAVAGAILMAFIGHPTFALGYLLALGVPVTVASHLIYLSRPSRTDPALREWYPAGRLLAATSLYGGALFVLILPLIGGSYDVLRAPMSAFLARASTQAPELGMRPLTPQQIEVLAGFLVDIIPGIFAAYWVAIFTLNLYLAGRVVRASGRLARDWPDLPGLMFPSGFPLLVAAAALAIVFGDQLVATIGTSFTGALLYAHLMGGLALMHFIARGRGAWILWFLYAGFILLQPYVAVALTLGGLAEATFQLKRRFGPAPPPGT